MACSIFKGCDPFLAVGVVPVALLNADKGRIGCLPEGLPMLRTGVADAWKNQDGGNKIGSMMKGLPFEFNGLHGLSRSFCGTIG